MIDIDAKTIKQWVILDFGATSHFLMTNAPAITILPPAMPIVAHLLNGEHYTCVHS
jgi:hypothetical protein